MPNPTDRQRARRPMRRRAAARAPVGLLAGAAGPALAEVARYNFQPPVTEIGRQIYWLHMMMLGICAVIFVLVFGVMFYSIYAHRRSRGHQAAAFHESARVEIAWTAVPFVIIVLMSAMATKTVVAMKDTTGADLTIKATGYQWKWGYDYLKGEGEGISLLSTIATPVSQIEDRAPKSQEYLLEVDHDLVVPVGKKVRVITTADDVIHSWGVPAFGVKQDAIPGFVRDTWFRADEVGVYRGQCYELCGRNHTFMPIVVSVLSQPDYTAWVAKQLKSTSAAQDAGRTWTLDELVARGATVYAANCQVCHQPNGRGVPGTFPALDGSKVVNGPVQDQLHLVLNGKNVMPAWKAVLDDADLAAVITFTRNHWGNHTGEAIQPLEVKQGRQ
jgi:cytochrome c oxidase subunit 2